MNKHEYSIRHNGKVVSVLDVYKHAYQFGERTYNIYQKDEYLYDQTVLSFTYTAPNCEVNVITNGTPNHWTLQNYKPDFIK